MKKNIKWVIVIVLMLVVGTTLFRTLSKEKTLPVQAQLDQSVSTKPAVLTDQENVIRLTGSIDALEKVSISSKISGRVAQVMVDNGAMVSKGQSLVQLDNTEQQNNLLTSQGNYEKAKLNLEDRQKNYERYQELYNQGAIALKDLEAIKMGLDSSQADLQVAAAAVANARELLNNTMISSPINGMVANSTVTQGQVVSPGSPLMTVQNIASVYVVTNVKEEDISKVHPGIAAEVTVDSYPDKTFQGTVEIINPVADKTARVFEVKVKVANPDLLLKPGMFAKVNLKTGEMKKIIMVPQTAVLGDTGQYYVFVAEGNHAKRQPVEIGQTSGDMIEIKSGLNQGQEIIVTNVNKLKDQDPIRVVNQ